MMEKDRAARKTMVCVTVQKTCERLIRAGAKMAGDQGLSVVHVVKNGGAMLGGKSDEEALDYLYRISRMYGAEMDMLRSDDVTATIVDFARKNSVQCIVIGSPAGRMKADIASQLMARLAEVEVYVVP